MLMLTFSALFKSSDGLIVSRNRKINETRQAIFLIIFFDKITLFLQYFSLKFPNHSILSFRPTEFLKLIHT